MTAVTQATLDRIADATGGSLRPCVECGNDQYTAHREIAFVPQIKMAPGGTNDIDIGTGQPFVTLTCNGCGLSKFYNAKKLGF